MNVEPKPNSRRAKCVQCGERKPTTSPKKCQIPNHSTLLKLDVFCSRTCVETFHAIETRTGELAA